MYQFVFPNRTDLERTTRSDAVSYSSRCSFEGASKVGNRLYLSISDIKSQYLLEPCVYWVYMALFTGKGDGGTTTAFGCNQQRISKSSELPEALGSLDELNAFLGFVKMRAIDTPRIATTVRNVQENLFIVQAEVAGADKKVGERAVKE